jgi:hypothetical protein
MIPGLSRGLMVPMLSADCVLVPPTGSFDLIGERGPYDRDTTPLARYAPEPIVDSPTS